MMSQTNRRTHLAYERSAHASGRTAHNAAEVPVVGFRSGSAASPALSRIVDESGLAAKHGLTGENGLTKEIGLRWT